MTRTFVGWEIKGRSKRIYTDRYYKAVEVEKTPGQDMQEHQAHGMKGQETGKMDTDEYWIRQGETRKG